MDENQLHEAQIDFSLCMYSGQFAAGVCSWKLESHIETALESTF